MKKNPEWEAAKKEQATAEEQYSKFMNSDEALQLREDDSVAYGKKVLELNSAIEAANKKVRTTRENI